MKRSGLNAQLVVGLVVITVGVFFILDNLGYLYAWDYLDYWPALFVVIGAAKFIDPQSSKFWATVFVIGGSLLLLDRLYVIDFSFGDLWPVLLIAVGGTILWGSLRKHKRLTVVASGSSGSDDDSNVTLTAIMGGFERKIGSKDFRSASITAIMGGCELDLRQADIKVDEAVIDVFAIWGGVELLVPNTWTVLIKGVPVMGGFSDDTKPPATPLKRLVVQGTVLMAGLEVKN